MSNRSGAQLCAHQQNHKMFMQKFVMGFGEMNLPVPTWGDYMDDIGTYGRDRLPGRSYAFIIEYNTKP